MQEALAICLPHMQQLGVLSTQQTFALRPVCRASRDTVDEMRLPVAVFFFPKVDKMTAGNACIRQAIRQHKDLPNVFREDGTLQNVLRCWPEVHKPSDSSVVRNLCVLGAQVAALQKRLQVTHVSLVAAAAHEGEDSAMLAAVLEQCRGVTHLDLSSNNLRSLYCPALTHLQGAADVSGLVYVNLQCNGIGDEGAQSVAARLRGCSMLTHLLLGRNSIGARGAECLARLMQGCPRLVHVDLDSNELGDDGTATVVAALAECKALTVLDLQRNRITEAGAGALADAVQHWPGLRTLRLGHNDVGDAGALKLAQRLCTCEKIVAVDLCENGIRADGAMAFADVIMRCRSLEELQLSGNDIELDTLRKLCATVYAMCAVGGEMWSRPSFRLSA